jgi:hypothetical protein
MLEITLNPGVNGNYENLKVIIPGFGEVILSHIGEHKTHPDDGQSLLDIPMHYNQEFGINVSLGDDTTLAKGTTSNSQLSAKWTIPKKLEEW